MTLGNLKMRLVKMFPGVDLTILEGFVQDVYSDILDELPWSRTQKNATLQTVAPYETGTVSLTNGSNVVTGSGTTFTSAMSNRSFRVVGRDEFYTFTYVGATSGTLDRTYEGTTASDLAYKIFQRVYQMPADCRLLEDNAFAPLERLDRSQLAGQLFTYGTPFYWASYMDDNSAPPRLQVQLDPIPEMVVSLPFTYTADASLPAQSAAFQAWMSGTALIEGVTARLKAHLKDYVGAAFHEQRARQAIDGMKGSEAHGMAPMKMELSDHFVGHRVKRWMR